MLKHEHTGKMRAHQHTSYAGLFFALLLVGVLLLGLSWATQAAVPAVNPQSGSVGLTGTVRGPAPTTGAVIVSPRTGAHVTSTPITVSGTCPPNTFVSILKNQVFAGATTCEDDGTFSLLIDLFAGSNELVARVSDALGQYGPNSNVVVVFYDVPATGTTVSPLGRQLFLESAYYVLGVDPKQILTRTVTIVGGVGPYAMSWDWGDGSSDLSSHAQEGPVSAGHAYERPGTYRVIVRVTDAVGNSAFLQLITVVNGPVAPYGATGGKGLGSLPGGLITAWPLLGLALLMVGFFWLGQMRIMAKLRHKSSLPQ